MTRLMILLAGLAATPSLASSVDMTGLDATTKAGLQELFDEELCPCKCASSFSGCIDTCKPARLLAKWAVSEAKQGVPITELAKQISGEIAGFSGKAKQISEADYLGVKGKRTAPITIVEYADFECIHCKMAAPVIAAFVKDHPEVRLVFKHFPLQFHAVAAPAARAVEAAGLQGRYWEMHEAIFATQALLDEELLLGHARAIGLDMDRFLADFKSPDLAALVDASKAEGLRIGVQATPSFFFNGRPFNLMRTKEAFLVRLEMEKARKDVRCK